GGWIALRLDETLPPARRAPLTPQAFRHGLRIVLGNRTTLSYMLAMGLTFGGLIGYLGASRQIFQDMFQAGDGFALYFGGLALLLGVASMVNSRFVGRWGMRNICNVSATAMVACSALFLAVQAVIPVTLGMFL